MANNNDKFISRENAKTLWGYMIDLLTGKQNKLTFDDTPTQGSDNPVKSGGIFTALAGKGTYSKPQNGIPKTDLENAVQTSLGLADSALQSETDPTVPSWAKATDPPITSEQVAQIETNKKNILYNLQNGVKNILNYDAWKTASVVGGTAVWENNGVTLTATSGDCYTVQSAASFPFYARIKVSEGDKVVLSWDLERSSDTYNGYVYFFPGGNVSGSKNTQATTGYLEYTVPANVSFLTFRFGVSTGSGSVLKYKNIMICTKAARDQEPNVYRPFALSNSDLTEDIVALADIIDSSGKNLWDFSNANYGLENNITYTKTASDLTVSSSAVGGWSFVSYGVTLPVGNYVLSFKISNLTRPSGSNPMIRVATSKNGDALRGQVDIGDNGQYSLKFDIVSAGTYYVIFGANWMGTPYEVSYKASELMISTREKYKVSQNYVISSKCANNAVGTVDFNNLNIEGHYYVSSATKTNHHAPKDGYYFVDVYTTENGEKWQRAFRINEPQYIYQRQMASNTWGSWYVFTGTVVS